MAPQTTIDFKTVENYNLNVKGGNMVLIEVDEKDISKVFEILSANGRFAGLPNNRFRIDEHGHETLEKITKAGLSVRVIDER